MAKKGKSTKSKAGGKKSETASSPLTREVLGWVFILISLFGLGCVFAVEGFQHPRAGDVFGRFATTVMELFGALPALLFLLWGVLLGLKLIGLSFVRVSGRLLAVTFLLCVETLWLMSASYAVKGSSAVVDYANGGGHVGRFLMRMVVVPIGGRTVLAPRIAGAVAVFFTLIFGFRWSPVAAIEKVYSVLSAGFRRLRRSRADRDEEALKKAHPEMITSPAEEEIRARATGRNAVPPAEEKQPLTAEEFRRAADDEMIARLESLTPEEASKLDPILLEKMIAVRDARDAARVRNSWILGMDRDRGIPRAGESAPSEQSPLMSEPAPDSASTPAPSASPNGTQDDSSSAATPESAAAPAASPNDSRDDSSSRPDSDSHEALTRAFSVDELKSFGGARPEAPKPAPAKPAAPPPQKPYVVPDFLSILPEPKRQTTALSEADLDNIAQRIVDALRSFRVPAQCENKSPGPVITCYELSLAPGVPVARAAALDKEIAMAAHVKDVRIEAPIPGKDTIGIEVPNPVRQIVYFRDILNDATWPPASAALPVALGCGTVGQHIVFDLARAPHLLVGGATGSGKSVCVNTILCSLLATQTPDDLRLILVDPKVVELSLYAEIPHLLTPVITDPDKTVRMLEWLCNEMDHRYEILARARVRELRSFNSKQAAGEFAGVLPEEEDRKMPRLVVIIDEFADIMAQAGKEFEKCVARIAAKARAVGIHLVLATQRPDAKIITGKIKSNLPSRIAFRTAQNFDSRTIIGRDGAEKLLGKGDMLFMAGDSPDVVRVHGCFLSDDDVKNALDAVVGQGVVLDRIEDFPSADEEDGEDGGQGPLDPLFEEVARYALDGGISISEIQRTFSLGFARAGRVFNQLKSYRVISPKKDAAGKRNPALMNEQELDEFLSQFRGGR